MAKFGPCLDTNEFIVDITEATAVGVWNPGAGTFTVTLGAEVVCGGTAGPGGGQFSFASIILNGSGRIMVTVSGTGGTNTTFQNTASVSLNNELKISYNSPGGGVNSCAGGALVESENSGHMDVCACSVITLFYDDALDFFNTNVVGPWSCVFTITVL
jgi:hypothetical protein